MTRDQVKLGREHGLIGRGSQAACATLGVGRINVGMKAGEFGLFEPSGLWGSDRAKLCGILWWGNLFELLNGISLILSLVINVNNTRSIYRTR